MRRPLVRHRRVCFILSAVLILSMLNIFASFVPKLVIAVNFFKFFWTVKWRFSGGKNFAGLFVVRIWVIEESFEFQWTIQQK